MEVYSRREIVFLQPEPQRPSEGSGILTPDHMPTLVLLRFLSGHTLLRFRFSAKLLILRWLLSAF
jgi:hypothetical protein